MGKQKIAVTLDKTLVGFLDQVAGGNRSEYLNKLLIEHREKVLKAQLIAALAEELEDPGYPQELLEWDLVAGDGIDALE
ncbi:conserved hypothetical protein (plasmid) [Rippkaea orientalis PCC 8801]|uniref:CopG family transcriptional regulator n=1 Tax=Rippkaea orientalis (strain PCC 8801 / RF-1) TaxID=41431 RepID=B7K6M1_RIPO1|nr:hypothetical protein [Rippkaea orientalis]ACK68443.1 conserved hypothetical protein [Rippkaea orientalis PCC 8801]